MTNTDNFLLGNVTETRYEKDKRKSGERYLARIGDCRSMQRFLGKYGKVLSWSAALFHMSRYFTWLREKKGITLTPDQLVVDNLKCVYESVAVDVTTKRRHTDWLDEFVNKYLVEKGVADQSRSTTASFVKLFYSRNDSPLFGDFSVSLHSVKPSPPPLEAEDVRAVLKALPLAQRTPLLIMWQGGIEINRVLFLTWGEIKGIAQGEYPLKLKFFGRKRHRRPYHTYIGKDSIDGLKAWREKWADLQGRQPGANDLVFMGKGGPMSVGNLNEVMRSTALSLARQGLVKNDNPRSWHSHFLRHSFETEGAHARAVKEVRGFFEGHVHDIAWVYNHTDALHEEDMITEYLKIEPYVSLSPNEAELRAEYDRREKRLKEEFEERLAKIEREMQEIQAARKASDVAP